MNKHGLGENRLERFKDAEWLTIALLHVRERDRLVRFCSILARNTLSMDEASKAYCYVFLRVLGSRLLYQCEGLFDSFEHLGRGTRSCILPRSSSSSTLDTTFDILSMAFELSMVAPGLSTNPTSPTETRGFLLVVLELSGWCSTGFFDRCRVVGPALTGAAS